MKNADISLASFKNLGRPFGRLLGRYKVILFILTVAILYGYFVMKIGNLANVEPSSSTMPTTTSRPRIDQSTVDKLQSLQDNSVNVQSLFDAARQNPFQE